MISHRDFPDFSGATTRLNAVPVTSGHSRISPRSIHADCIPRLIDRPLSAAQNSLQKAAVNAPTTSARSPLSLSLSLSLSLERYRTMRTRLPVVSCVHTAGYDDEVKTRSLPKYVGAREIDFATLTASPSPSPSPSSPARLSWKEARSRVRVES